jgi:hypothetical protein
VLEPSTKLIEGWPLEAICLHLEALTFGQINRLLINVKVHAIQTGFVRIKGKQDRGVERTRPP